MAIEDFEGTLPEFLPEEFFNGKLEGWGVMESPIGGLQKRATISAEGSWDPASQTVTFTETYSFDDGHTDTLHWAIKKVGSGKYANVGLRFWAYVTTGPLTLLTLASLFAAWRAPELVRQWWLIATVAALVERIMTFAYFVPTMITLMREGALSDGAAVASARRWAALSVFRHAATLVAWLAALKALSEL